MDKKKYQICKCCVMDTSDEDITFNEEGICNRCIEYKNRIEPEWNHGIGHEEELEKLISTIKNRGKNNNYDCILGLSGGLDSTYMLHLAVKEWKLRPFVLHIDTGWDLPIAKENIDKVCKKLDIELHEEHMNWNEMRAMQIAWFRTGLENLDSPQDHAFIALIDKYSKKLNVKYILNGYNISTEIIADPSSWSKGGQTGDYKFMKDVIRKYCDIKIKKYSFTSGINHKFINPYIRRIKTIKPLNLVSFDKNTMIETLVNEYNYVPYEQKHFEDLLTKFLEGWWQPSRFGHDIRRAQLSSLIITGQMSRKEALEILKKPPITEEERKLLINEICKKLEISEEELMKLHELPYCTEKFRNQDKLYKFGIRLFEILGLEKRIRK